MRTPNLKDLTEAWADRYCAEHDDLDHDNGCPAQQVAQNWLTETIRQAKEQAWDEGHEDGAWNTHNALAIEHLIKTKITNPYRSQK